MNTETEVIVTAYNQPATLRLVLEALAGQTEPPARVGVADDGSGPAMAEMLRAAAGKLPFRLRHVRQPDNGFRAARARNNAIAASAAPVLAFLDQDVLPGAGWLQALRRRLAPETVCLGESVELTEKEAAALDVQAVRAGGVDALETAARRTALRKRHRRARCYACLRRLGLGIKSKPRLKSGNFMVHRASLLAVNGFDEAYEGWGQEDDDLGRRLYRAGLRPVVCYVEAPVFHLPHPARRPADWKAGANAGRFRGASRGHRCSAGLSAHPHADVVVTDL